MKDLSQLIELPIKVDVSKLTHEEREQFQKKLFEHGVKWACGDTEVRNMNDFIYVDNALYLSHIQSHDTFYSKYVVAKEIKVEKLQEVLGMKPKQFTKSDLKDGMVMVVMAAVIVTQY